EELVAAPGVLREAANGGGRVTQRDGDCVLGKVVEQGRCRFEEERQVVFDPGKGDAVADILVGQGARGVTFEDFPEAGPEAVACGLVHGEFAPRQQLDFLHGVQAALRVDVEAAYGFDLVIEEIDAVGQHRTHGKEIDQPTANAEFAGGRDL